MTAPHEWQPMFQIGDVVAYDLSASHHTGPDCGTVIGYSFRDVCLVATETAHGMPINAAHCRKIGRDRAGQRYRERYESLYHKLLPAPPAATLPDSVEDGHG